VVLASTDTCVPRMSLLWGIRNSHKDGAIVTDVSECASGRRKADGIDIRA
jgi:hypothetical protein